MANNGFVEVFYGKCILGLVEKIVFFTFASLPISTKAEAFDLGSTFIPTSLKFQFEKVKTIWLSTGLMSEIVEQKVAWHINSCKVSLWFK